MKQVILMSLQNTHLALSPARYQILEELSDRGYETYIFLPGYLKNRKYFRYLHHVINVQEMSISSIRKKIKEIKPQVIIASTAEDMGVLYPLPWIMKNTSFYYYNLEIYTPYIRKEIKKEDLGYYLRSKIQYPIRKFEEIMYTRKIKMFTIQDELRRKVSAKYHIQNKNTMLIPNSYFFDDSKIVDGFNKVGVVYSGGMRKTYFGESFNLIEKIKDTPVTFSGEMDQWCKREFGALKRTNPNIRVVEKYFAPDEFTEYLRQFAVGLVWYDAVKEDDAHYYMGLSSGKMFKHLSIGQPIIAVKCHGITREVKKYKLGVVIDNFSELDMAYRKIMEKYSYYQHNVLEYYKEKSDFKKVIKPFLDYIDANILY
ncbi:MAG: hypothetical protein NC489_14280 [Ruminococcus flavefaciens]|nr:hypothetical protein [Ruminococcus flavefaciens]